jgi:hypothetical protein
MLTRGIVGEVLRLDEAVPPVANTSIATIQGENGDHD